MPWTNPKIDWDTNPKSPVADDFNRIEGNIEYLNTNIETKKGLIVDAINTMGRVVTIENTHAELATAIKDISNDATAGVIDVLEPKTFYQGGIKKIGSMPNNGPLVAETVNLTSQNQEYSIASGYHSGFRKIKSVISNLAASAIKAGVTVGGILGTFTSDATAAAGDILSGITAYVNGNKVTGTMIDRGAVNAILTTQGQQFTIAGGKHSGLGKIIVNIVNLIAENIKNGVNVGGVVGTLYVPPPVTAVSPYLNTLINFTTGMSGSQATFTKVLEYIMPVSGAVYFSCSARIGSYSSSITMQIKFDDVVVYEKTEMRGSSGSASTGFYTTLTIPKVGSKFQIFMKTTNSWIIDSFTVQCNDLVVRTL